MARRWDVTPFGSWVDRYLNRSRSILGANTSDHTVASLERHREVRPKGRPIACCHRVDAELVAALGCQREADEPARFLGHEVDRAGRRELRGDNDGCLVCAGLVAPTTTPRSSIAASTLDASPP